MPLTILPKRKADDQGTLKSPKSARNIPSHSSGQGSGQADEVPVVLTVNVSPSLLCSRLKHQGYHKQWDRESTVLINDQVHAQFTEGPGKELVGGTPLKKYQAEIEKLGKSLIFNHLGFYELKNLKRELTNNPIDTLYAAFVKKWNVGDGKAALIALLRDMLSSVQCETIHTTIGCKANSKKLGFKFEFDFSTRCSPASSSSANQYARIQPGDQTFYVTDTPDLLVYKYDGTGREYASENAILIINIVSGSEKSGIVSLKNQMFSWLGHQSSVYGLLIWQRAAIMYKCTLSDTGVILPFKRYDFLLHSQDELLFQWTVLNNLIEDISKILKEYAN